MLDCEQVNWCKLTDQWYQKFFQGRANKIIITYHYGGKYKSSSQVMELKSSQAKRYCSLRLIEKDLRDIKLYLKEYKNHLDSGNKKTTPNNTSFESLTAKAFLTAIVIHYNRCFPGTKGRSALLQEKEISNHNMETHRFLKNIRNTYIAHSDISRYESCSYLILIPPKTKLYKNESYPIPITELYQALGMSELTDEVEQLIQELYEKVDNKLRDCEKGINTLLSKLSSKKVYEFLKGKGKRVEVSLSQFKKLTTE